MTVEEAVGRRAPGARREVGDGAPHAGRGGARAGRALAGRAVPEQVPARPVRRAEAARGDRPGDRPGPRAAGRRRAGLDARHERAGEDPAADARPQAGARAHLRLHHPRPGHARSTSATGSRSCTSAGSSRSGRPRRSSPTRGTPTRRRCWRRSPSPTPTRWCRATCRAARSRTPPQPPLGCAFHPRCPEAVAGCGWESRDLRALVEEHWMRADAAYDEEQQVIGDLDAPGRPVDHRDLRRRGRRRRCAPSSTG